MKKALIIVMLLAAFGAAPSAFACSPAPSWPPSATENLKEKDFAFVGTVTSVMQDKSINGNYHVTFAVQKTYKGDLDNSVTVVTRSSSAACGYDNGYEAFKKGTVWSIFGTGTATDGYETTSLSLNEKYGSVDEAVAALSKLGLSPIDEPVMCTLEYAPMCGKAADGSVKTYGNSCMLSAAKATKLYEGECKTEAPSVNLWRGSRGEHVTWLQNFLISKLFGKAGEALKAVGATGYFGSLTSAALAEYQELRGITPAVGYFGPKTRAAIEKDATPAETETFTGTISSVNTGCFADGICSVTVSGKDVILLTGMRTGSVAVGSLKGVESIGDLEKHIGDKAKVYAARTTEGGADYTLYGSTSYYVEVLEK